MSKKDIPGAALVITALTLLFLTIHVPAQSGPSAMRLNNVESDLARIFDLDGDDGDVTTRPRVVEKAAAPKTAAAANMGAVEHRAFAELNKKRAENGLAPLEWSDKLEEIAHLHSQNMAEFNFFSHKGLDSKWVSDRADDAHLGRWHAIGENIAFNRGFSDPIEKAVQQWLDSPEHRRNLLNCDWKESAVGVAVASDGSYYFTQVFLKK